MPAPRLSERIKALETEVARLKANIEPSSRPWWEEISGSFANDPLYEKAMRLGRQYRTSLRPNGKKPRSGK